MGTAAIQPIHTPKSKPEAVDTIFAMLPKDSFLGTRSRWGPDESGGGLAEAIAHQSLRLACGTGGCGSFYVSTQAAASSIGDDDGSDTLVFQSLGVFGILYRRDESQEKSLDLSKPGKTNH